MSGLNALIDRATDATLTDDNWQFIFDVCDAISKKPEVNTVEAMSCIKKKLESKDANVLLRLLSLLVAVAENCGSRMKQQIASSSFLEHYMIKKLSDKSTHRQIKVRIAEVLGQLRVSFRNDPSLLPIEDAFNIANSKFSQFFKQPPNKPAKEHLTETEQENEQKELERALKMSVQEYEREQTMKKVALEEKPLPPVANNSTSLIDSSAAPSSGSSARIQRVRALYDLISYEPDELSFRKGDTIRVIEAVYRDWWRGMLSNGKTGIFPLNYVTPIQNRDPELSAREMAIESRLIEVESKKINKLLAVLSQDNKTVDEEELAQLFNQVIPLKASLAKSIEKYGSRREHLNSTHNELGQAFTYYNQLIDRVVNPDTVYAGNFLNSVQYAPEGGLHQQPTSSGFGNGPANYIGFE